MIKIGKDIQVEAKEYKGKFYIHIRKWYEDKDGELKPGKGISLNEDDWKEFLDKFEDIKKDIENEMDY